MSVFNKIAGSYKLGSNTPITAGVEDLIYIYNSSEFIEVYDINNPLVITGLFPINGANLYKFTGTNNSFNTVSKLAKSSVGPRFTEEIDFNIANVSTDIKTLIMQMGYGRVKAIAVNNYKSGDSAIELFGAINGLIVTDSERNAADETVEGGYKIKLTNPDKIREPYPPRAIGLTTLPVTATVPLAGSATSATMAPVFSSLTPNAGSGSLAAVPYFVKIVSVDALGTTVGSNELTATATLNGTLTAVWLAANGAVSYRVYIGTVTNTQTSYFTTSSLSFTITAPAGTGGSVPGSSTATPTTAIPGTVAASVVASGALANGTYYAKVTAVDLFGETIGSTEVNATTSGTNNSVQITWASTVGAVKFRVYIGTAAGAESFYYETTALSFTYTGVTIPASYQNTLARLNAIAA
ncbi:MAG TPA: hypothetical protein VGN20_20570 [Mucilaginibacter sp.]|jgi:hypothetical protein